MLSLWKKARKEHPRTYMEMDGDACLFILYFSSMNPLHRQLLCLL